jgi:transposase
VANHRGVPGRHLKLPGLEEEVAARYVAGESLDDLAAEHGVDRHTITRMVQRAGVAIRRPGRPGTLADEEIPTVIARYTSDPRRWNLTALAEAHGTSRKSIRRALVDAGVAIESRPGPRGPWHRNRAR